MQLFFSMLFSKCLQGSGLIRRRQTALKGEKPDNCTRFRLTGGKEGRERAQLGLGGNQLSVGNSLHTDL